MLELHGWSTDLEYPPQWDGDHELDQGPDQRDLLRVFLRGNQQHTAREERNDQQGIDDPVAVADIA